MIADRLAWAALVAVLWLTLASFAFLWMAGLLDSPGIHAWARPWQWLTYARLFGRSTNEQIYLVASGRRWCTRQVQGEMALNPKLLKDDRLATDGIRALGRQHPVQHRHANGSLSPLGREAAGSQTRSDQRLVTTHCRFH